MAIVAKYSLNWNANDSVGSNNGTASNITYVAWKSGQAGKFNPSNSFIQFATTLNWTESTFEFIYIWLNNQPIFTQSYNNWHIFNIWNNWWFLQMSTGWMWWTGWVWLTTIPYNSNAYYHIVMNRVATRTWACFVNWIKYWWQVTLTTTKWNEFNRIWRTNDWNQLQWNIDEFILHNTALTPAEIKNKYLAYNWFI